MDLDIESSFSELVAFIRRQIGEYDMPISRETLIEDDLGVTGEEAYDLILSFSAKYNVKIENFNFAKYFNEEPSVFKSAVDVTPFTIMHLEKAIIAGRLDEQVINL